MKCQEFEERLSRYIDGDMTGELLEQFEQHGHTCTLCGILLESVQANKSIFESIPDLEPPAYLTNRILDATSRKKDTFADRVLRIFRLDMPLAPRLAGAALILIFMITVGFNMFTQSPSEMLAMQDGNVDLVSLVDYNGNRVFTKAVQAYQAVEETYDSVSSFFSSAAEFLKSNYEQVKNSFKGEEEKKEEPEQKPKELNQTRISDGQKSQIA
jgi:hypothetical protein